MLRWLLLVFAVSACGDDAPVDPTPDAPPGPGGNPSIAGTPVSSFETSSCATSVVLALSTQIAEEVDCIMPGQLVPFAETTGIRFSGSAVLPYISQAAKTDLLAAAAAATGRTMSITSGFRTVVQQYLLFRWFQLGRCGIPAAAEPGRSNHESGRALDMSNYNEWISTLAAHGWSHNIPGDPVHFEHLASPDIRGADILAFQRLWNRNALDDQIAEDGDYGPATETRLKMAPAEGFGIGAICGSARLREPTERVELGVDPGALPGGERVHAPVIGGVHVVPDGVVPTGSAGVAADRAPECGH
ncbi:MAG: D-alanyl-D-alanine carboxypeptidase family protein [Deltaproteobacteria bacterium]|nr:D-alanyl-D-alanine carboxypeptidase family protein [Deltaproteobacteria bacterium]